MSTSTQNGVSINPLVNEEISVNERGWSEWLASWRSTRLLRERLGLLHTIFAVDVDTKEAVERVVFLLEVADGFGDKCNFDSLDNRVRDQGVQADLRQDIARKAFKVLAGERFRQRPGEYNDYALVGLEAYRFPELFWAPELVSAKLLWFFRSSEHGYPRNLSNLNCGSGKDIAMSWAREFAEKFCRAVWRGLRISTSYNRNQLLTEDYYLKSHRQIVPVLSGLGRIFWLLEQNDFPMSFYL